MTRATGPVRWWVRLYTSGLPPTTMDERRAELESDLWEQVRSESEQGLEGMRLTLSVWTRWLLGIPDDLAWRAEQIAARRQGAGREGRRPDMLAGSPKRRLVGLSAGTSVAVAIALLLVLINQIRFNEGTQPSGAEASALLLLVAGVTVLGVVAVARGFRIMASRPMEGAVLVVGGSLVAGLVWYWLIIPPLVAVALSIYGLQRAMSIAREMPRA